VTRSTLLRLLGLLTLVGGTVAAVVFLPLKDYLSSFVEWVQDLGFWGPAVFAVAYALACLFVPASLLTLGAGFVFGVVTGTVVVSLASVTGASIAFWLGRTLARGWVENKVAGNPRFQAIDRAVAEKGFKIVLLTRLSPVFPFLMLNYAFGLTRVRFRDYFFASWVGMFPGTVLYVYLGSTAREFADIIAGNVQGGPWQKALYFVGLAVTVVVTVYVTRLARAALKQAAPGLDAGRAEGVPHA
jgi:uncharacterized membrane protein YdjX (TVP38/TMEM64 family)